MKADRLGITYGQAEELGMGRKAYRRMKREQERNRWEDGMDDTEADGVNRANEDVAYDVYGNKEFHESKYDSEVEQATPNKKEKCVNPKCDGNCELYHNNKMRKLIKKHKKDIEKKWKPVEKKEGLVNGPQFSGVAKLAKSVGWAVCKFPSGAEHSMCCVRSQNGVFVNRHIGYIETTRERATEISFQFGDEKATFKWSEGKEVGLDLMYWNTGRHFVLVSNAKASHDSRTGQKVGILTYGSLQKMVDGDYSFDTSTISSLITTEGNETAYYHASTVSGNCGSPIFDTDGRILGIHRANAGNDNVCTLLTRGVLDKVVNSTSRAVVVTTPAF